MSERTVDDARYETLARRVQQACIDAALEAYEAAGVQGLCAEGRWECAVGAMRRVDPATLLSDGETGDAMRR